MQQRIVSLLIFLAGTTTVAFGQLTDNFSDGDFTNNPVWFGQDAKFMVNGNQQLQLDNAAITDEAYLVTQAQLADTATWEFYLKLGFDPSNNNNVRVYLMSDQADLTGSLNGYFIRIGENGSSDGVDLYEQSGTTETKIVDGIDPIGANDPEMLVRVTRTTNGQWSVWADTSKSGSNYQLQGTATDATHNLGWIFGVFCKHTTSNSTNFYFDDFSVGPIYQDTLPPTISSATVIDPQTLEVAFSEPVDLVSAETVSNYSLDQSLGNPVSATRLADSSKVELYWSGSMQNGVTYTLTVSNVEDQNGNALIYEQIPIVYNVPAKGDVLISELMADPNPQVSLPDAEYLELFNNTAVDIDLAGWKYSDATSSETLPAYVLPANSFLILCDVADTALFTSFGSVLGLSSWPTLNNSGDMLSLETPNALTIHTVNYDTDWYGDPTKESGGWSLEMKDPEGECLGQINWSASDDPMGGTPGKANSNWLEQADTTGPKISAIEIETPIQLLVVFDRAVDPAQGTLQSNYSITPNLGSPSTVASIGSGDRQFRLTLAQPIQQGVLYELEATGITDCRGYEAIGGTTMEFIDPDSILPGDIVINEVLFNPKSGGSDYVELYNNSDKVLDLQRLMLLEADPVTDLVVDAVEVAETPVLFRPGEFYVLTEDRDNVIFTYFTPNPDAIVDENGTPNYPDETGTVIIWVDSSTIIDRLTYHEDWQFGLLDDVNGVSLERIFYDRETQDKTNWFSASSEAGYGTPGYKNSQAGQETPFEGMVTTEPEVFSPDGDGYKDQLFIRYQFSDPGYVGNIQILDNHGRLVKAIVQNELLAQEGSYTWDGIREDGRKAELGIYIIYVEVFNLNGKAKSFKRKCVLGGRL